MRLVTKTTITNPYLIDIFKPNITFVKEINFYANIIPAVQYVEEKANVPQNERIDAFIQHFGARISLDPSKCFQISEIVLIIDQNAMRD